MNFSPHGTTKSPLNETFNISLVHSDFADQIQLLREAPLQTRMVFVTSPTNPANFADHLKEIDWVIYSGTLDAIDLANAEEFKKLCRDTNTAFFHHQPDKRTNSHTQESDNIHNDEKPAHPFGCGIDLSKPTLPAFKETLTSLILTTTPGLDPKDLISDELPALRTANEFSATASPTNSVKFPSTTAVSECEVVSIKSLAPLSSTPEKCRKDFERLDGKVRNGLKTFIEVGNALKEIRDRELWRLGDHLSWDAYCQAVAGLTKSHGNRLIKSSAVAGLLQQVTPIGVTPRSESQVRPLCKLKSSKEQTIAWTRAVDDAGGIQPTAQMVSKITNEILKRDSTLAKKVPDRQKKLAIIYFSLRSAIREGLPKSVLERHLAKLQKNLGIKEPSPN